MGKVAQTLKSMFTRSSHRKVPPKQINRWEGEGGAYHDDENEHDEYAEHERRQDEQE